MAEALAVPAGLKALVQIDARNGCLREDGSDLLARSHRNRLKNR